jgi:hypothetical protein
MQSVGWTVIRFKQVPGQTWVRVSTDDRFALIWAGVCWRLVSAAGDIERVFTSIKAAEKWVNEPGGGT